MPICEFGCGKEATHQFKSSGKWCCSTNVNACEGKKAKDSEKKKGKNPFEGREHHRARLGKSPPQKGKTYEEYFGEDKAKELKVLQKANNSTSGQNAWLTLSEERKEKIREGLRNNRIGGYIKGCGRGKKGWYKGYWCDSSWELAWVIYHLEHDIKFERNTIRYTYIYEGEEHKYLPDFIVNDELVEIKGYWTEQVDAKIKQCPKAIKLIDKAGIKPYIDYVVSKYGRDFTSLYE